MKKRISITHVVAMTAFVLLVSACGSKKVLVNDKQGKVDATTSARPSSATKPQPTGAETLSVKKMSAVMRVNDNAVTTETISSKIKFNIKTGSKDITVPGTLRMKKDDVIRLHLQIPILGSEAGRLEFTKDYVLILDRIHKEYIKADYNQVEFLQRNGLTGADIDKYLLHQANMRIIECIREHLEQPREKFPTNIQKYGNTSSASVGILIDELSRAGELKDGQTLMISTFGGGFVTAAAILDWSAIQY